MKIYIKLKNIFQEMLSQKVGFLTSWPFKELISTLGCVYAAYLSRNIITKVRIRFILNLTHSD